jgi:sulfite reductase (ferredoxin)
VGKHQATARPIGYRIPATEVPAAIERLLRVYLAERRDGENFRQFAARYSDDDLREFLAWAELAAAARDAAPGRPPHGVDG